MADQADQRDEPVVEEPAEQHRPVAPVVAALLLVLVPVAFIAGWRGRQFMAHLTGHRW